ncbi:DUF115 domain-containing protein [Bacillus sp. ISL-41]|uniref:6-hydroxymethylpterin diphosphokinase MptE-like protein n=1 Tax=Bacillus sp. ISL-41 TaxID=2819127 RepID=UPI001BE66353|nr:6-hydroxymethylpterin diphosphokinase MptE-like protein [Bacillus sp. ISL-41]MBT2642203.1 DUF115 domain-containing protein [Bacillus sp. ISL-41]
MALKKNINQIRFKFKRLVLNNIFPYSISGKDIKKYKNLHENKRCFIIGNGPSLKSEDLDKLKNEITFAFNRIYSIFDQTEWRPTYYCSEDDKTILNSKEEINNLKLPNKFIPVNFPWDYKIHFKDCKYYILKLGDRNSAPAFSNDMTKGLYWGNTVAYTAMQMAVYMGIKEIYLLGVDHNFSKMINDRGEVIIDEKVKDYFSDEYNPDKDTLYIPNVEISKRAFSAAKKYADQNNIKIYNATRGGKLEVFERINFDEIKF